MAIRLQQMHPALVHLPITLLPLWRKKSAPLPDASDDARLSEAGTGHR